MYAHYTLRPCMHVRALPTRCHKEKKVVYVEHQPVFPLSIHGLFSQNSSLIISTCSVTIRAFVLFFLSFSLCVLLICAIGGRPSFPFVPAAQPPSSSATFALPFFLSPFADVSAGVQSNPAKRYFSCWSFERAGGEDGRYEDGGAEFKRECERARRCVDLLGTTGGGERGMTGFGMTVSILPWLDSRDAGGEEVHCGGSEPMTACRVAISSTGGEGSSFMVCRCGGGETFAPIPVPTVVVKAFSFSSELRWLQDF